MNYKYGFTVVPLQDGEKSLPFAFSAIPDVSFANISYGQDNQFVKLDDSSRYQVVPLEDAPRLGRWINR